MTLLDGVTWAARVCAMLKNGPLVVATRLFKA